MKILIAVPTFESIYPDTFKSIYDMDKVGQDCVFEFIRGYDVATARNKIVSKAQEIKADYMLMIDNDMVVPKDALINFLNDIRDVTLGYAARRPADNRYDGRTSVSKLGEYNYTVEYMFKAEELREARGRGEYKIQIHGGGMACAFIRTDVFDRIRYPWYDWINYRGQTRGMLSEDLYFCEQCRKAGIPIYVDTRVACGHMFRYVQEV